VWFGLATLVEDVQTVRDMTKKMELRYLGEAGGPELDELLWFRGQDRRRDHPVRRLAWDQGKG
jgi:hypothetical protein